MVTHSSFTVFMHIVFIILNAVSIGIVAFFFMGDAFRASNDFYVYSEVSQAGIGVTLCVLIIVVYASDFGYKTWEEWCEITPSVAHVVYHLLGFLITKYLLWDSTEKLIVSAMLAKFGVASITLNMTTMYLHVYESRKIKNT